MAVKHLFAAVHIERRTAFAMQRTKSGNFLASLVASGFPAVLQEKLQQRKAPLEDVTFGITHGGNGSTVSMPAAARKSQARMVGAEKNAVPRPTRTGGSSSAATSSGWWRHPARGRHPGSPVPPAPRTAHRPPARGRLAVPASCRARAPRTTREGRSACDRRACRGRAGPESNRVRHRAPGGAAGHVPRSHASRSPDTGVAAIRRHTPRACIRLPDMG